MRWALLVVVCAPAIARADDRLDLAPLPDLAALAPAYELDRFTRDRRDWCGTKHWAHDVTLGAGAGDDGAAFVGALAAGTGTADPLIVAIAGELIATDREVVRAQHHAIVEYRATSDHDRGSSVTVETTGEHGDARGLAPARLGSGRRTTGDARAEAMLQLGREKDDFIWVAEVEGAAGGTRWLDTPGLDHAARRSVGLGLGRAPADGEIPRGTIDVLHGRVEHVAITRRPGLAIALGTSPARVTEVRSVELGLGARELTFHVDHELLAVIVADLGWTWLETDTDTGTLADNMFRMRLATAATWVAGERHDPAPNAEPNVETARKRLGVALAREPGYSADGQRLVSDWRLALESGLETARYTLAASGGVSWLTPTRGGAPADTTVLRYGSHVEGFAKLAAGLELGGYHAITYEPHDAWVSPRAWTTEAGLLLRWRNR